MWKSLDWKDYTLLDCGAGERLERWGKYILVRPDPQAVWQTPRKNPGWTRFDARYHRSDRGGGSWENLRLPESWTIKYKKLTFNIKPMSFKHTGVFPEQAANWDFAAGRISRRIAAGKSESVLNLFAYTGAATINAAAEGASVVHVDAAKGMVAWAKDNAAESGLKDAPIRYIVDDCVKFVRREIRRGNRYDGILMDPPSYGRGPTGEMWKIEDDLYPLVELCAELLSDSPCFFLINSYTTGLAPSVLSNVLKLALPKGNVEADEVGLPIARKGLVLPCGASGRWVPND